MYLGACYVPGITVAAYEYITVRTKRNNTNMYMHMHTNTYMYTHRLIDRWIKSQVKCCGERTEIEQGRKYQG